ncbi:hypothetical protein ACP4OV_012477 [Aristida adscensionis]
MPCTLSTQKRARHALTTNGWSSLIPDLVHRVGDCLLASDDLDYYIDFRAVCRNWRSTTTNPKENGTNPLFHPHNWVLLKRHEDTLTLVNVETDRFLVKNMPLLRKYFFVSATTNGLILLGELVCPYQARVLNPFTGSIVHFKVCIPSERIREVIVTTLPMMIFISSDVQNSIMWADQNNECFCHFKVDYPNRFLSIESYAGNVYLTNRQGSILSISRSGTIEEGATSSQNISIATTIPCFDPTTSWSFHRPRYLVKSRGELLLVTKPLWRTMGQLVVQRVDTKRNMLEPMRSIGNHALFISCVRCLSVDANKFHTVDSGYIHFVVDPDLIGSESEFIDTFCVANGEQDLMWDMSTRRNCFHPFTLTQDFADYCKLKQRSEEDLMILDDNYLLYSFESDEESFESDEGSSGSDEGSFDSNEGSFESDEASSAYDEGSSESHEGSN